MRVERPEAESPSSTPRDGGGVGRFLAAVGAGGLVLVAGCGREEVRVYRVPKESEARRVDGGEAAVDAKPQARWKVPSGWEERSPGPMRVAHFLVRGEAGRTAEVTVVPLRGGGGGDLDNYNRWRGQIGLAPVAEEQMKETAQTITVGGESAQFFDIGGGSVAEAQGRRMLAAILRREQDGMSWFFKMTGESLLIESQKPVFLEFLESVSFEPTKNQPPGAAGEN